MERKFVADDGVCYAERNEIFTRELANEDGSSSLSEVSYQVDFISQIPDDVLLLILSRLTTEEAIRTSVASKRWENVWKKLPHLVLNTRRSINPSMLSLPDDSNPDAELTRVINNHYGHLESCEITHFSYKCEHGLLETWIQTVETRHLTLANGNDRSPCYFPLEFDSHSKLTSLSLKSYILFNSLPFSQICSNIKTLKLLSIFSPKVGVFNNILTSCPSLEMLVLNVNCTNTLGTLKIENSKLKFLEIYSIYSINKVIVSAPSLDILVARDIFTDKQFFAGEPEPCEFLIQSPNLQFNTYLVRGTTWLRIIYNISKEENNGHEHLVNRIGELTSQKYPTLTVAVDLMNETEVERLRQLLCLWSYPLNHFEITFKGNNAPSPSEEIECWQKKLWVENDHEDPFPDAIFRVNCVSIHNFRGSKEEIAFVSCLIRQGKVRWKIRINSKPFSANNRSNIKAAVLKLREVQSKDQQKVTIEEIES